MWRQLIVFVFMASPIVANPFMTGTEKSDLKKFDDAVYKPLPQEQSARTYVWVSSDFSKQK